MASDHRFPKRLLAYHPSVDVARITQCWDDSANPNYRWCISIPFKGRATGKRSAVIMLNPSWTDGARCDQTVFSVQYRLFDLLPHVEWIDIVNLWAYRDVNPQFLAAQLEQGDFSVIHHPDNDVWIRRVVSSADVVVAGWGGPPKKKAVVELRYLERLLQLKGLLDDCGKPAAAVVESTSGYPYHGRHWFRESAKASELLPYSWSVLGKIPQLRGVLRDAPS